MTQTELEHLTVKSTPEGQKTPEVQILVRFALRTAVSKISHILSFPIDSYVKRPQKSSIYIVGGPSLK